MKQTWKVSRFAGARDVEPARCEYTLHELCRMLATFRGHRGDKLDSPAWSPASYPEGATRCNRDVHEVSCAVLDFDAGDLCPEDASDAVAYTHIIHTSWSHTPEAPKFRLVFPLAEPIPRGAWPRVWAFLERWWADVAVGGRPDPACKDPARLFFLPVHRGPERMAWMVRGRLMQIPWRELEEPDTGRREVRPPMDRSPNRVTAERIRALDEDPARRRALGLFLNGQEQDGLIRRVLCPRCNRPDVWFPVDPAQRKSAQCNHRNSCGWYGRLYWLALELGVEAE